MQSRPQPPLTRQPSRLLAPREAQAPVGREIHVVVLDCVVQALVEGLGTQLKIDLRVVLHQWQQTFDQTCEQAAKVLALVLFVEFDERLLRDHRIGRTGLRASHRIFQGFRLELIARYHAVDEPSRLHFIRREGTTGEEHL